MSGGEQSRRAPTPVIVGTFLAVAVAAFLVVLAVVVSASFWLPAGALALLVGSAGQQRRKVRRRRSRG